jgi:L-methionine (R)-S-oxide reductase
MSDTQLSTIRSVLLERFSHLALAASSFNALQHGIVEAMALELSHYSWTGFYMLDRDDPETLVLGPFVGDPTPHVRIPVTQVSAELRLPPARP